jgi:hypothetical protein
MHRPDGEAFSFNPKGFGPSIFVRRFRYEYTHSVMPPTILELNGKTYLMPLWKEVVKGTTVNDIEWIKPKPKRKFETVVVETPAEEITYEPNDSDEVEDMVFIPDPTISEMELAEDLLEYFTEEEEYEKCANIRDIIILKKTINRLYEQE